MRYLTIIDSFGGYWCETKEEAWDMVLGGAGFRAQIVDTERRRFTDIIIGGGPESMKDFILSEDEISNLRSRVPIKLS